MFFKTKKNIDFFQVKELLNYLQINYGQVEIDWEKKAFVVEQLTAMSLDDKAKCFEHFPILEAIDETLVPYVLAGKKNSNQSTIVTVGDVKIGGGDFVILAGPCAVESQTQINQIASGVKKNGADILRGGIFKPRSSPYDFQGLEDKGIEILVNAKKRFKIPIVSEIMDASQIDAMKDVDVLQIGTKNMQNYSLLKAVGRLKKPIILKRGYGCTIEEFLLSAEYVLASGNKNVILCERGVRTFQQCTRNTLDVSSVPILKKKTHLPIIIDPSHVAGRGDLVKLIAEVAMVIGADGVMVEVHNQPQKALCDGKQALDLIEFIELMNRISKRAEFEKIQKLLP